ncbi:MAG: PEP-CTERM sorting domain-containing protein [Pirellulales bacterium]|nr:PEP-CTERM sorting domain-containing protein [Pirellulales bacterium]
MSEAGKQESTFSQFAVAVPEPGTITLLAIGLFGLLAFARKHRQ